jgi:transposase
LQVLIEKRGHICLFLPKFHCELNPIEMVWAQIKRRKCSLKFLVLAVFSPSPRFP